MIDDKINQNTKTEAEYLLFKIKNPLRRDYLDIFDIEKDCYDLEKLSDEFNQLILASKL